MRTTMMMMVGPVSGKQDRQWLPPEQWGCAPSLKLIGFRSVVSYQHQEPLCGHSQWGARLPRVSSPTDPTFVAFLNNRNRLALFGFVISICLPTEPIIWYTCFGMCVGSSFFMRKSKTTFLYALWGTVQCIWSRKRGFRFLRSSNFQTTWRRMVACGSTRNRYLEELP